VHSIVIAFNLQSFSPLYDHLKTFIFAFFSDDDSLEGLKWQTSKLVNDLGDYVLSVVGLKPL